MCICVTVAAQMGGVEMVEDLGHGRWPTKVKTVHDRLRELGPSPHSRRRRAQLIKAAWDLTHFLCVAIMSLTYLALENEALRCPEQRGGAPNASRGWFGDRHLDEPPPHCAAWSAYAAAIWREATVSPLEAGCACFTNVFLISMCGNSPLAWLVGAGFASVNDRQWDGFVQGIVEKWGHPYDGHASYAPLACRKRESERASARERAPESERQSEGEGRDGEAQTSVGWPALVWSGSTWLASAWLASAWLATVG